MGPNRVVEAISCDLRGSVKQKFSRYAPRQLMVALRLDCLLIRPASNAVIIKVALTGEKVPHPWPKPTFELLPIGPRVHLQPIPFRQMLVPPPSYFTQDDI